MKIISHRGFWIEASERNTRAAFERTLSRGFGTETDVRDCGGRLVVAHDPAVGGEIPWDDVLSSFDGNGLTLAVNVKADGLAPLLAAAFSTRPIEWFAFDMSAPEMLRYQKAGLPFYTRHSDIEPSPILYEAARGVWLDAFTETWFDCDVIDAHLVAGKEVCVVSSELHGRAPDRLWDMLKKLSGKPGLTLCTDLPEHARRVFEV